MVCSACAHRQQCWLFCLLAADRARVLLAVRPNINKAILSLIDGDPLNYRTQTRRKKNNPPLVKVSFGAPRISTCVREHGGRRRKKKRERMSRKSPMHFSLFRLSLFFCFCLWSDPVWSCYYPGALSVCSCLFRSGRR